MFLINEFHHLKINLEDIILATDNFSPSKQIGHGGFGWVYKGELRGRMVAFKRLDRRLWQGDIEFWKEIMMLSKLKHENLIELLHFCSDGAECILVYEYASRGSLDRYLSDASLTWIQRLKICIQAARAINYLHDPKGTQQRVLHRDIKSANILLDENWDVKVSDFGLAKIGLANQSKTYLVSNPVGTVGYSDPLCFETGLLSKESDVYSFGVVLFEVMCGKLCFEYRDENQTHVLVATWKKCFVENRLDDIIFPALKGQMDEDCLMTFSTIAYLCSNRDDHQERPTMAEIVNELEAALEKQVKRDALMSKSDDVDSAQLRPEKMLEAVVIEFIGKGLLTKLWGVFLIVEILGSIGLIPSLDWKCVLFNYVFMEIVTISVTAAYLILTLSLTLDQRQDRLSIPDDNYAAFDFIKTGDLIALWGCLFIAAALGRVGLIPIMDWKCVLFIHGNIVIMTILARLRF